MRVLDYIRRAQTADLQGKVDEAKRAIIRVKKQAIAKQKMCEGSAKAKQSVFEQKKDLYLDSVQEVKKCLILRTQAGVVVYYVPENTRSGASQQGLVALGETVKEGQKMLRIPDLSQMVVNAKVHEAVLSKVQTGTDVWQPTGFAGVNLVAMHNPLARLATQAAIDEYRTYYPRARARWSRS